MEAYLRAEAIALPWEQLDDDQQAAVRHLVGGLREAVELLQTEGADASASGSKAESRRENRVFFLSGARGTGKTSVLKFLMRALTQGPDGLFTRELPPDAEEVRDGLGELRFRVALLEPLDMEPLPAATNLLAALLARIDVAVGQRVEGERQEAQRSVLAATERDYHEAMMELQSLKTDVALSWGGNLAARAGHLDPDNYAYELMRAERARLNLDSRLNRVLTRLASSVYFGHQRVVDPLFVLLVDDVDLNPARIVELLRLLRIVSVRRLFCIIVGDLQMAEAVFNLKVSADLAEVSGASARSDLMSVAKNHIAALAGEVAANALRKLLPPGQRIELRPMSAVRALEFRPREAKPTLRSLLERPAVPGYTTMSLADFLTIRTDQLLAFRRPRASGKAGGSTVFVYTGAQVLEAPPRHVVDLWHLLSPVPGPAVKMKGPSGALRLELARVLVSQSRAAVSEDPNLLTDERKAVLDGIGASGDSPVLLKASAIGSVVLTGRRRMLGRSLEIEDEAGEDEGAPKVEADVRSARSGLPEMPADRSADKRFLEFWRGLSRRQQAGFRNAFKKARPEFQRPTLGIGSPGFWAMRQVLERMQRTRRTDYRQLAAMLRWPDFLAEFSLVARHLSEPPTPPPAPRPAGAAAREDGLPDPTLDVFLADGWNLFRRRHASERGGAGQALSCSSTAWLILLHDVARRSYPSRLTEYAWFADARCSDGPQLRLHEALAWITWAVQGQFIQVPWYSPAWPTFWQWDQHTQTLIAATNAVDSFGVSEGSPIEFIRYAWLSAASTMLLQADAVMTPVDVSLVPGRQEWEKVAGALLEVADLPRLRAKQLGRGWFSRSSIWLVQVAAMLTPEAGCPPDVAGVVLEKQSRNSTLIDFWKTRAEDIRALRQRSFAQLREGDSRASLAFDRLGQHWLSKDHPINTVADGIFCPQG